MALLKSVGSRDERPRKPTARATPDDETGGLADPADGVDAADPTRPIEPDPLGRLERRGRPF
jgi:hypothetical protein